MNPAIYAQAKKNGCSDRMAELLASRKSPRLDTDKEFFKRAGGLKELPDAYRQSVIAGARQSGYEPSPGDTYMPGLADYTGDPKAFVSRATGARGRMKEHIARCKSEPIEDPLAKATLADDIVADRMQDMIAEDPGLLERRSVNDVREEVIDKHGPQT